MEDNEAKESGIEENETEESDRFENFNEMLQITPISNVKMANFQLRTPNDHQLLSTYRYIHTHLSNRS